MAATATSKWLQRGCSRCFTGNGFTLCMFLDSHFFLICDPLQRNGGP